MRLIKFNIGYLILIIAYAFLSPKFSLAQDKVEGSPLIKLSPVKQPKMYEQPTGKINKKSDERVNTGNPNWIVYSDRENNKTYSDRNCTKGFSTINFMQPLIVAEETDNEVRLAEFDISDIPTKEDGKKTIFKSTAIDKGWIKKSKLLLWQFTLVNDTSKYSIKAIAVKRLDKDQDITKLINRGRILDVYDAPVQDKQYLNERDSRLFEYLFILKDDKENKMFLLSRKFKINPSASKQDVLGWVPYSQVHKWDNVLCLRMNFESAAVNEREDKKIDVKFFKTKEDAKKYRAGGNPQALPFVYGDPANEEKDNPYYYGFPIIEDQKDESVVFKTGYVTNTVDKSGNNIFTAHQKAKIDEKFETFKKKKENVNFIFLLDGIGEGFYESTKKFIQTGNYFKADDMSVNKYKVGAIIYNDITASEDEKFIKIPLTNNGQDFCDRLDRAAAKKLETNVARIVNGAPLFEAISKACDIFPKDATNIIILTGTTKDGDGKLKNTVVDKLVDKQVKMSCYQIANKGGKMYDGFLTDCKYIMQTSAERIDKELAKSVQNSETSKVKSKFETDPENKNKFKLKNSGIPGEINVKDNDEAYTMSALKAEFAAFAREQDDKLNSYLNAFKENTVTGKKVTNNVEEKENNELLIERAKQLSMMLLDAGIGQEDIQKLSEQENFQLFVQAYTTLDHKALSNQLLVRTLFMQKKEFERLLDAFEIIAESTSLGAQRTALQSAFKQIIIAFKGPMDTKVLENYDSNALIKIVASLPRTNNPLFDISIKDMADVKKTPDAEISKLIVAFNNIFRNLDEVRKMKKYWYETDDERFFWVPESAFRIK